MKNVMITGSTRGLGLAIVMRLLAEDYRLICIGRRPSEQFTSLADTRPLRVVFCPFDLTDLDGIPSLISRITRELGPLYGLINNAGIGLDGILATQHATEICRLLRLNLEAPVLLTKYACRSMLKQKEGRIINISSIIATTGFRGLSVYAATKAGLEGFSRSLSRELGPANITVNCIAPGFLKTEMTARLRRDKLASIERRSPLGLPTPSDVAGAVVFLLSPDAVKMTGTVLKIDGGSTA
jgi:3-oxoacyl-[acyl-carrier protein] reductase